MTTTTRRAMAASSNRTARAVMRCPNSGAGNREPGSGRSPVDLCRRPVLVRQRVAATRCVAAAPLPAEQQQAPPTPQAGYVGTGDLRDLPHRLRHVDRRLEARPGQEPAHADGRARMRVAATAPAKRTPAIRRRSSRCSSTRSQRRQVTDDLHHLPQPRHARALERQPARSSATCRASAATASTSRRRRTRSSRR